MPDDTARTQAERSIAIDTPLGDDKLLLVAMHGAETLGRMFQYELDLMSEGSPVDFKQILGQNVTIRVDLYKDKTRYFNGFISKFALVAIDEATDDAKKIYTYRATMVPWMWFLTRTSDCRIFQDMTVPDIVQKIFKDRGHTDIDDQLTGTYRKWEYCVQYRETDFNFVSRLMENEGIYYYFSHENGKHTIVLCDAPSAHDAAEDYDTLHFDEPDFESGHDAFLWNWSIAREITPNQYALTDYDPLQPQTQMEKVVNVDHTHDPDTYEIFDYPGGYVDPADGRTYTNTRMEELEAQYTVGQGTSSARGIFAGCTFALEDHPTESSDYLVTSISYQIKNDDMGAGLGKGGGGEGSYMCQVTCIPKTLEYRTPRTTPKPVVQGPQTAKVVGPSGEEIYSDKYGRVKVHFYWDRTGTEDEKASCWVRVSQPWAGKKWGAISIPRMGQEVIVEFMEGDPDRPIITGRVYNGDNMPPHELPTNQTMTTFKTNTSKGGNGFNELRFEDKKDSEEIYIWAQKNMQINVQNDRFETVKHDRHLTVKNDNFLHVENKMHTQIDADYMEIFKADHHEEITGKEAKKVGGSKSLEVDGDVIEKFNANHSETTATQYYVKATDVIIEGTGTITIKVGGSSISIGSDGIKIQADGDLTLISSGATKISADTEFKANAPSCKIAGDSDVKVSGGSVKVAADGMLDLSAGGIMKAAGSMIKLN